MKPWHLPSGRQRGIAFLLPDDWTPEQALAVVELLDDLRERIYAHYQAALQEVLREQRQDTTEPAPPPLGRRDPPF